MIGDIPLTLDLLKIITKKAKGQEYFTPLDADIQGKTLTGENCELEYISGIKYKGRLEDGQLDGKGTMYFKDGVIYEGEFNKGLILGKGKYIWTDGSKYEGEVVDALRQGYGVFTNVAKGIEYKGNWKKGLRHGKGEIGYQSGAIYKGEFKNGRRNGFGVIMYKSGNFYQGQFKDGKKWGYGEMYWEDTKEIYRGFWEDDRQNGYGEHLWLEKQNKHKDMRNRYEGMFLDGMRHGIGCFYYSDGTRYEGEWNKNRKEGYAFFTDSFGETIEAIFKSDRIHERLNSPREYKIVGFVGSSNEEENRTQGTSKSSLMSKSKINTVVNNEENSKKASNRRNMMRSGKTTKTNFKSNKEQQSVKGEDISPKSQNKKSSVNNTLASFKNIEEPVNNKIRVNKEEEEAKERKLREFTKRNEINQITNPYVKLLRLDDLLEDTISNKNEREKIISSVEIVLMRYNPLLTTLYQFCKYDPDNINERSFSLKLKIFWRFLRKAKILTPSLSISQFNKLFYSNESNIFKLRFQFEDLREQIKNLKLKKFEKIIEKIQYRTQKSKSKDKTQGGLTDFGQSLGIGLKRIREAKENEEMSNSKGRLGGIGDTYKENSQEIDPLELNVNELSAVSDHEEDSLEEKEEFYNTNYLLSLDPEERELELMKRDDVCFRNHFGKIEFPLLDYSANKSFYKPILKPFDVPGPEKEPNFENSPFAKTISEMDFRIKKAFSKDLFLESYNKNLKKMKILDRYVKQLERKKDEAYAEAKKNAQNMKKKNTEDEIIEIDSPISGFPKPLNPIQFKVFDIHDGENIMLYRNFIDALLRVIYVREDCSFSEFKRKIEKYIEFRIRPLVLEERHPEEIFGPQVPKKVKEEHIEEGESFVSRVFFDETQSKRKTGAAKKFETSDTKNMDSNSRVSGMESYTDGLSNTWNSARYSDIVKLDTERDKSNSDILLQEKDKKKKKMQGDGKQIIESCKRIMKYVFNKNLKNRFLTPEIEEYYGKVGEATTEMVMDCKSLISLMERSGFIKEEEDKDILIQIVERHFDPDSSFTAVMDKCLKQQPFLFLNTQGSFGLSSYYKDNVEDLVELSSLATSEGWRRTFQKSSSRGDDKPMIRINTNNKVSAIDMKKLKTEEDEDFRKTEGVKFGGKNQTERGYVEGNDFELGGSEMKSFDSSPSNVKALLKATENMKDFIGDDNISMNSKEIGRRVQLFDQELAEALNRTLGSEILFFEFVEIFVIYCYSKVNLFV